MSALTHLILSVVSKFDGLIFKFRDSEMCSGEDVMSLAVFTLLMGFSQNGSSCGPTPGGWEMAWVRNRCL